MPDSPTLSIKPIIHYPRVAQVGKTYLMTIDLEVEEEFEWQYDQEEYPIYCEVDSELFSSRPVGEPVIVLHRFGGSYGEAKFLLKPIANSQVGEIRVTLTNKYGISSNLIIINNIYLSEPKEEIQNVFAQEHTQESQEKLFTHGNENIIRSHPPKTDSDEIKHLYEAKLIIVGEGGAGKTSLARKLLDPDYQLPTDDTSTQGIDILKWDFT